MSALPPKADIRPREGHVRYVPKAGTAEQALATFTLMKVIGRDIWIGIWAFIFALISTLRWEAEATGVRPSPCRDLVALPEICAGLPRRLGARHAAERGSLLPGLQAGERAEARRPHQGLGPGGSSHFARRLDCSRIADETYRAPTECPTKASSVILNANIRSRKSTTTANG
jgi:hypothetical protein